MKYLLVIALSAAIFSCRPGSEDVTENQPIDRNSLVSRHNVNITSIDSLNSLSVGNGSFSYTVDITGLQSFPDYYRKGIPLGTMSNWGWHSFPNTEEYSLDEVLRPFEVGGETIEYVHDFRSEGNTRRAKASAWLRENPHRLNLGTIGFHLTDSEGSEIGMEAIQNPVQVLDLWSGLVRSKFEVDGMVTEVETFCHPEKDLIGIKVKSGLIDSGRLAIKISFDPPNPAWHNKDKTTERGDHQTEVKELEDDQLVIERNLDQTRYFLMVDKNPGSIHSLSEHELLIKPEKSQFQTTFEFSKVGPSSTSSFESLASENKLWWSDFWSSHGAVDFSKCTDPRAFELERRTVLSQYLMKTQCSGKIPPQETGLIYNSWHGKFHMEMPLWHSGQFALWDRLKILEDQLQVYRKIESNARQTAMRQGFEGVRWPKMTDPSGRESPSTIGTYLIWQQPHYIYFAEMLYQFSEDKTKVIENHKDLVFATAEFMVSYATFNEKTGYYDLGPGLIPAQERFDPVVTTNPAFEMAYWYWALSTAIDWAERDNIEVNSKWTEVLNGLAPIPENGGFYLFTEQAVDSYTDKSRMTDHPMVIGIIGLLPTTDKVDMSILERSFDEIITKWHWQETWGWDYPMIAMTAAELGRGDQAIDLILMDTQKNTYLPNGHNYQHDNLAIYLPGNGAFLMAIARMCTKNQFPGNDQWNVKWEGLNDF